MAAAALAEATGVREKAQERAEWRRRGDAELRAVLIGRSLVADRPWRHGLTWYEERIMADRQWEEGEGGAEEAGGAHVSRAGVVPGRTSKGGVHVGNDSLVLGCRFHQREGSDGRLGNRAGPHVGD
jgi:hypothetical protein